MIGWALRTLLLPMTLTLTRSNYLQLATQIEQRQNWPIERIREFQLARLRSLMEIAIVDSAFYRERFGEFGVNCIKSLEDLSRLPITNKSDIESNFPDRMTAFEKLGNDLQYVGTRGTTRRVVVIQDFVKRDATRASELVVTTCDSPFDLGQMQVAIPPDACSTHCGIELKRAERVRDHLYDWMRGKRKFNAEFLSDFRGIVMDRWIRSYQSLPPMPSEPTANDLAEYVAFLRKTRPRQLIALPEYLRALAAYIAATGDAPPPISVVRPMGANMPVSWKPSVANAFGGTVRENYGSREMGPMAYDCRHTCGLHVLEDQFLIEVVHRDGTPVADGELGQVLITDLQNFVMPIIRYRIGDLARIDRRPCQCGRASARIFLEGRIDDAFVTKSGKIVTAEEVANCLFRRFGIDQFELVEQQRRFQLRYVPPSNGTIDELALGQHLADTTGLDPEIRVRSVESIRPESTGKFRHCKSSSFSQLLN